MFHLKVPLGLFFLIITSLSSYCQDSIVIERGEENVLMIRKSKENKTSIFRLIRPDNIGVYFGPALGYEKNKLSYYANNSSFYVEGLDYSKIILYNKSTWTKTDTFWDVNKNFYVPSARKSISFGVKGAYSLGKVISVSPELSFVNTGASLTTGRMYFSHINYDYQGFVNYEEKHKYSYLDFILPIKFTPTWLRFHPYFAIGPELGLVLSSKREVNVLELEGPAGVKDSMAKYGLPISSFSEKLAIPKIQAGMHLRLGLGYYLSKKWELQFELRDFVGYTNMYHYGISTVRNNIYSLTTGLVYHFNIPYVKRVNRPGKYNRNTGLKTPEPFLPQAFRYMVLQFNMGLISTAATHLQTVKKANGPDFSLRISYLKSIKSDWLVEPYFQASSIFYTCKESFHSDSLQYYPNGITFYSFGALSIGTDLLKIKNGRSRFKPFWGGGISLGQILQLYRQPTIDASLGYYVGRFEDFNFYRIPSTSLKILFGTFYRFKNSHYLRLNIFVNHSLYPTTLFRYSYYRSNHSLVDSGIVRTFNFAYGFSISYTLFNLNKLKKELKKEMKQE